MLHLHLAARGDFRLTVEAATSSGRRSFVLVSGSRRQWRLGRRYFVGLGSSTTDLAAANVNLAAIAAKLEPGTAVRSITGFDAGVADSLHIALSPDALSPDGPKTSDPVVVRERQQADPPADPPRLGPIGPQTMQEAFRFLTQTTFGATSGSMAELMELASYPAWIDHQLALPPSLTEPYTLANSDGTNRATRHQIWWTNAIEGDDQLRQRLAFAWSQIFVVSDWDYPLKNDQGAMCNYYDMLATGCTGNFRDLLENVTTHPVMGVYLSMVRNEKADPARNIRPDENFAREILQLFTIGLHQLTPDGQIVHHEGRPVPSYNQRTIEEFAKVFTGWNFADANHWVAGDVPSFDLRLPMTPWEQHHETQSKQLLSRTLAPGGATADDLGNALDDIFNHSNVGPFLARLLIQRLVASNPTPAYVGRVAAAFADDGEGVRGNLAAVTRAILLDPEARQGHRTMPNTFGKMKEPIMRLAQLWRAFDAQPGPAATDGYRPRARAANQIEHIVGQAPMRSDSVFNFFPPDHRLTPGSDLVAPELAILAETHTAATNNMLFEQIYGHHNRATDRPEVARIQIDAEIGMAGEPALLVDHLDLLLTGGTLPIPFRNALATHLDTHPVDASGLLARTLDAIYGVVGSPAHLVQK